MKRPKCKRCSRPILGSISIDTYRRQLGRRAIKQVDYYDYACFRQLNMERSWNAYRNKKATLKGKSNR